MGQIYLGTLLCKQNPKKSRCGKVTTNKVNTCIEAIQYTYFKETKKSSNNQLWSH